MLYLFIHSGATLNWSPMHFREQWALSLFLTWFQQRDFLLSVLPMSLEPCHAAAVMSTVRPVVGETVKRHMQEMVPGVPLRLLL